MKTKKLLIIALIAMVTGGTAFADTIYVSTLVDLATGVDSLKQTLIEDSTLLLSSNTYILDKRMYVGYGQDLYIQPGTVIKAEFQSDSSLVNAVVVSRGGQIWAEGTQEQPIVFTSVEDPLDGSYSVLNKERWGGVIILGYAYNNILAGDLNPEKQTELLGAANGLGYIEGLPWPDPRHWYGAADTTAQGDPIFIDDDNSGVLKYVSIRHGGIDIGEANEINGLTLGSVGSGTTLENIEIVSNGDDGVEFFGGTASIKYLSVLFCEDDYLDWDQGWDGNAQFILGVMLPPTAGVTSNPESPAQYGDNGFECDGDDGQRDPSLKLSKPTIFNATIIGPTIGGDSGDKGLELKERTRGTIANSIFAGFAKSVDVEMFSEDKDQLGCDTYMLDSLTLVVKGNLFLNCGGWSIADSVVHDFGSGDVTIATRKPEVEAYLNANNSEVTSQSVIDDVLLMLVQGEGAAQRSTVTDAFNAIPDAGLSEITGNLETEPVISTPVYPSGFFNDVAYRGCYQPDTDNPWSASWSYHETLGTSFINCPADVNGDRNIDVSDFLDFAVKYGQSCRQAY